MATDVREALTSCSARELAEQIRRGEVSATEVVEAHIVRIEQVNPSLNAVVIRRYDEARDEARAIDERRTRDESLPPLAGVPLTLKECLDLAGTPSTFGLTTRAGVLAERDDPYVARMRAAGAIVLGKTNVPQMLFYTETDNPVYGRTNNPWDQARTPGGSSGGEAAIIAAQGSPLGLTTDWGGSTRTPAAFCGLAALMPTAGRLPDGGRFSLPPGQQAIVCQVGPMARTVDDLTLALEVLNGGRGPTADPRTPLGYVSAVDVSRLRVGYFTDDGVLPVAPAVKRAVVEAAGMLAGRGAEVIEWRPPQPERALDLFYGILAADGGRSYRDVLRKNKRDRRISSIATLAGLPRPLAALLGSLLRLTGQQSNARVVRAFGYRDTSHYWKLVEAQAEYRRQFQRALDTDDGGPFDVIVCPAFATPAFPHGLSGDLLTGGAYAPMVNLLGYPAGVVPVTRVREDKVQPRKRALDATQRAARAAERGSAGLPIGVQVVARPWQDHIALAALRAIEEAARRTESYPSRPPLAG